jgi:hypothetical protein
MPTGDSVWSPLSVIRLVANVATGIRVDYKHLRARVEDPHTGGGVRRSQVRTQGQGEKKNRLELCVILNWGYLSLMNLQLDERLQTVSHR